MIAIASSDAFHAAVAAAATAKPLVVFFTSTECSKCEDVTPQVTALAEELAASAAFATVGAEELEALVKELQVDSFPHFRVYKDNAIDCSSSTFDEVDAYVRGLVVPDTPRTDDASSVPDRAPEQTGDDEGSATKPKEEEEEAVGGACDAEAANGSKKRQEREEEMESNDGHAAKKMKTDDGVAEPVEDDGAVVTEEAGRTNVAPNEEETPDGTEKKRDEGGAADKTASSAAAASDVVAA
ncbi:unnamed protein product [Hyaloperonospora brassicae]|uniref:Thioredoxin domain-containing protein n=1 Tax=Hyaloperonospora brassicae TaxID=162125 RepID=A0AAV0UG84_HYABA|nr:unnamed protein product [Hyaloperonospora brassicae]